MKTPVKILGAIFLLLALTIGTMPGVHAVSQSGSEHQALSFPKLEPGARVSALLSMQVDTKLRCQQVPLTAGELSMMQARGMRTENLGMQRIFIHLAQEPTAEQLGELRAMGITPYPGSWIPPVGKFPTGFIVADMPIDQLGELADKSYVAELDTAEQLLKPQNDLAAIKINADDVWNSGYDGTDVRVAVIDSGLDTTHPDIPAPVASKDYSNWPVLDDTIANTVTGHGTHVAGSVLGRGTQSSGATYEYKGMAPDADLIFLKIGSDATSNASLDAMTNAIKAAVDTYYADIITMSYGGWGYYHDGTRQSSQAVDYAFSQGAVVFISAGNEGSDGEHYSGTVNAYSTTGFIQVNVTGSNAGNAGLGFNLVWYDGLAENNDLVLEYYDSTQTAMADIWTGAQEESWKGTEHEISGYGPEAGWYYYLPAGNQTYYLRVTNNSSNQQFFHIYYENLTSSGASVEFQNADPFYTISSPADAEKAIAVGAYTTRQNWTNYEGDGYTYGETLNTMASFSSRGPRVDSGAPQKPNIVAPGSALISVRDTDVYTWPGAYNALIIDNDGLNLDGSGPADYYVMQGTSMASPIAAGAAALLLEAKPALKGHPADVRNLFQSTATSVNANNNIDGYGLLDIDAALDTTASDYEVDWLFMVYLDADNNLESAGIDDLNEMEVAGSTDQVKIVVEMDRADRDYDDDTTNGNWTGAKRFYVTQDADQAIINSPVIADLGEVNMGDPATLQSFIEWAVANYPTNHYALVLWNHGSGWRGGSTESVKSICVDDQAGDELTMTELRSALNAANATTGKTLDIVGFDACLMHMVEVAYQVRGIASRPLVDITVGSEEIEPGDGWDYASTLTALTANPAMTPAQLATQIVSDYITSYGGGTYQTQSAADLDYIEELATAVDNFAQAMIAATGDWTAISTARSQAQEYYYTYYIDLYHFAQLVNQDATISQAVRDAASAVMTAVTNTVIAEQHGSTSTGSNGLSIYYPETSTYYFSDYETEVLFSTDTQWDEFLYAILFTSPTEPDISVSPTSFDVTLAPDTTQDYTLTISNVGGGELTYDISDQDTTGSEPQATIESTPTAGPGIDAAGNEVLDKPGPSTMTVPRSAGEVITSFSAPGTGPLGLAWDGTYLWNADWETEMIYRIFPSTGAVVQSFASPGGRPFGLTYDGTYLWVAVRDDQTIYQLNPLTGSVVDSIPSPGINPQGLTWDGEYLWVAEYYDNAIYKLDPSDGSIVQSFSWTGTYTGGLAWDGTYLWHCDSDFNTIYKLNPTDGSVVTSFSSPADWPAGLTWDGTYLWSSDSEQNAIYKIDVGEEEPQDCSWLSEAPVSGTVAAGSSDSITVTIDTTGLAEGSYSADIIIASNDPDEASTTVSVALEVSAAEPEVTVSIDAPAQAAPDSDFTANVDISQVTDFDSCNYDVTFDASVLRLDDVTSGLIGSTEIPVGLYNEVSPGTYSIVQNVAGTEGVTGSGYLAVLHFHVVGSSGDSSTITLSNGVLSDNQAVEIPATWVGDSVDISSVVPGDANGDGVVNALDITKVERIVAGLDAETAGADANQDGNVNALDITKIERIIAGLD